MLEILSGWKLRLIGICSETFPLLCVLNTITLSSWPVLVSPNININREFVPPDEHLHRVTIFPPALLSHLPCGHLNIHIIVIIIVIIIIYISNEAPQDYLGRCNLVLKPNQVNQLTSQPPASLPNIKKAKLVFCSLNC